MGKAKSTMMGTYMPTSEETKAYQWCINNGIFISPSATGKASWYIEISIGGKTNKSPETYGKTDIWIKLYEFYKYYYDKYEKKI